MILFENDVVNITRSFPRGKKRSALIVEVVGLLKYMDDVVPVQEICEVRTFLSSGIIYERYLSSEEMKMDSSRVISYSNKEEIMLEGGELTY